MLAVLARDGLLTRAVRALEARLLAELPTVAELPALAVGAGEGAAAALERVARPTRASCPTDCEPPLPMRARADR